MAFHIMLAVFAMVLVAILLCNSYREFRIKREKTDFLLARMEDDWRVGRAETRRRYDQTDRIIRQINFLLDGFEREDREDRVGDIVRDHFTTEVNYRHAHFGYRMYLRERDRIEDKVNWQKEGF